MDIKMYNIDWYKLGVWILIGIFCCTTWYYGYKVGYWLVGKAFG